MHTHLDPFNSPTFSLSYMWMILSPSLFFLPPTIIPLQIKFTTPLLTQTLLFTHLDLTKLLPCLKLLLTLLEKIFLLVFLLLLPISQPLVYISLALVPHNTLDGSSLPPSAFHNNLLNYMPSFDPFYLPSLSSLLFVSFLTPLPQFTLPQPLHLVPINLFVPNSYVYLPQQFQNSLHLAIFFGLPPSTTLQTFHLGLSLSQTGPFPTFTFLTLSPLLLPSPCPTVALNVAATPPHFLQGPW
eukprot:Phypoly_transcript_16316.p1 GENE.Phypoly_transcript_16316~~Phypoly_transcript_16316.p1  ORF type:complete len:241 (-),score=27.29 Phypoly_transcript_16316:11-733(-)